MKRPTLAVWLALALALPQAAAACAQLSEHVWMCDRGTPWEAAQWDAAGDGATRILGDVVLNFTEEWPGFEIADELATLEERYATYVAWVAADGMSPLQVLQSDNIAYPSAYAMRTIQRDEIEGEEFMSVVMLAQVGEARIMLYLDAPENTELAEMDTMSRSVLALLQDSCADEISCAEDYQLPPATTDERG